MGEIRNGRFFPTQVDYDSHLNELPDLRRTMPLEEEYVEPDLSAIAAAFQDKVLAEGFRLHGNHPAYTQNGEQQ